MSEEDKIFIENYEKLLDKGYCNCNEMNCIDNNSPGRILNITKDLQQRINNAIEYIKYWHYRNDYNPSNFILDCQKELLSILEGKELE